MASKSTDGLADPLGPVGATGTSPGPGPYAQAPLAAAARAALCASGQNHSASDVSSGCKHRVVFGTLQAVEQVFVGCGWNINTAFVECLNLDMRQRVAAIGRRVTTLCQDEAGCSSSWCCSTPTTTSFCPTRAYASHCWYPMPTQRYGLGQAVAALHPGNGRWAD